jgi:hypothetical protein
MNQSVGSTIGSTKRGCECITPHRQATTPSHRQQALVPAAYNHRHKSYSVSTDIRNDISSRNRSHPFIYQSHFECISHFCEAHENSSRLSTRHGLMETTSCGQVQLTSLLGGCGACVGTSTKYLCFRSVMGCRLV